MAREIDLWFSATSTYTYLTVMQLARIEADAAIRFRLRPFYLAHILQEMGHVPFVNEPAKLAYMWRDIERKAQSYELTPDIPAPFPVQNKDFAIRLAFVALQEDWGRSYLDLSYRAWFEHGNPPGEEPNVSNSIRTAGGNPDAIKALAFEQSTDDAVLAETDIARSLGIFGSPTIAIGKELFWGNDRIEDALDWARGD